MMKDNDLENTMKTTVCWNRQANSIRNFFKKKLKTKMTKSTVSIHWKQASGVHWMHPAGRSRGSAETRTDF
jgi:ribosomal protein L32E